MADELAGRVCIITGGAHGIGRAYATAFATRGARVVVADIDGSAARAVADQIEHDGGGALGLAVDVADSASCVAMAESTVARFGAIDVLIANAAMFATVAISRVAFDEISEEEWDRLMAVNVKGVWLSCRAVVPQMRLQGTGKIITIGSGTIFSGHPTRIHYVASKAAMIGFTRTLAREVGGDGITVNLLCPGSTLSEEAPDDATLAMRERDAVGRALARVQRPEDLIGPMVFLASSASDFMTGQTINVDGGKNLH